MADRLIFIVGYIGSIGPMQPDEPIFWLVTILLLVAGLIARHGRKL